MHSLAERDTASSILLIGSSAGLLLALDVKAELFAQKQILGSECR